MSYYTYNLYAFIVNLVLITAMLVFATYADNAHSKVIRIAVASNFVLCLHKVVRLYTTQSQDRIDLISGSTGKLYAQITNGAPFDALFAADTKRPRMLEQEQIGFNRFTYAYGRLVLWSPKSELVDKNGNILRLQNFRYLAIANPKLAPYGRAAHQVLKHFTIYSKIKEKLVHGENIAQTYQFIHSGNADLGFIALSQLGKEKTSGSFWIVPRSLHEPINQQAIQISHTSKVQSFLAFIQSKAAELVIQSCGYDTP